MRWLDQFRRHHPPEIMIAPLDPQAFWKKVFAIYRRLSKPSRGSSRSKKISPASSV
ncbi:MAG: hypothetical protein ACR2OE_06200 [Thermomicrobiales bacterium]